jgi:hypothetical protein|tara:strand:+ start:5663 stop:6169 length:507 start_codon:yes stop_codon:yes gene_type:complete
MLKWLNKITSNTQDVYWESIEDLPLYNWIKCNNEKYIYTRKDPKGVVNKNDLKQWVKLYDEYLGHFGLNDRYEKYLEAQRKKALLQAEYIITKNNFKKTEIAIQEAKLKNLELYFGDGQDIEVILMYLGKFLGYKIQAKQTSVKEYFTLLEEYGKANKKIGDSRKGSL